MAITRCGWVGNDKIYQDYHDQVWGRPVLDDKELFAKLCLDGQQAGLSWITILKKQTNFERAFHNFEPVKVAAMSEQDVARLMTDKGIIRNKLKINAMIKNARAYLAMEQHGIKFADFIWSFVDGKTIINQWRTLDEVPTSTPQSDNMAKALKQHGFSFVGTTICYAFMQATGLVNDHLTDCHSYHICCELARRC